MATTPYAKLAEEIRAQRARLQMSQDDLARAIGMHPNTLTRRVANPGDFTISELSAVAYALKADVLVELGGAAILAKSATLQGQI